MQVTRTRILAALAAVAAVAVAAAFGGSYASAQPTGAKSAVAKRAVVKLRSTPYGKVLVDASGRTLYLYTPDKGKTSVCYGQCASYWPPLLTTGAPRAGAGAKASLLGVTMRKDGKHQVTYAGHPLYFFASDAKAGQTNGQGVQGIWWVVSAAGKKVTKKAVRQTSATALQLRSTSLGSVLVDGRGHTLYLYEPDASGKSTCYGQCASFWPPLIANGKLVAGKGVLASKLGTTKRTDGSLQVTYAGHPLYFFAQDSKAGDTKGEDVQGIWYVVSAAGAKIEPGDDNGATTTTGSSYGGY
jgi:predicted lipoprotein with Yx(FWY)xxD motif